MTLTPSDLRLLLRLMRRHLPGMALGVLAGLAAAAAGIGLMALSGWFISATAVAGLTPASAVDFQLFFSQHRGARLRHPAHAHALRRTCLDP